MKRDKDLIRTLLLVIDGGDGHVTARDVPDGDARVLDYHLRLLAESGLVISVPSVGGDAFALTRSGSAFLARYRSDAAWQAAKRKFGDDLAVPWDLLMEWHPPNS